MKSHYVNCVSALSINPKTGTAEMNAFKLRMLATTAVTIMALAGLVSTAAQADPRYVLKNGTDQSNTISVPDDGRYYSVRGKKGNDLIETETGDDKLYGDEGTDTLDGHDGDDLLYGGTEKDYFRYGSLEEGNPCCRTEQDFYGFDSICDFATGDKIDIYQEVDLSEYDDETPAQHYINGGNFSEFDTNGNGTIDKNDAYSKVQKSTACGTAKDSLVIDVAKARNAYYDYKGSYSGYNDYGDGTLTIYGKTSLKRSDFVLDYSRDLTDSELARAKREAASLSALRGDKPAGKASAAKGSKTKHVRHSGSFQAAYSDVAGSTSTAAEPSAATTTPKR